MNYLGSKGFYSSLELCAGGGGQALGLFDAGIHHAALVEIDHQACETLRLNHPEWRVIEGDLRAVNGADYRGVDLVTGGVPCPPFSVAGKQLGPDDDRDLFPEALRIVREARPVGVLLENVPGFASKRFDSYRSALLNALADLGYWADWRVLQAADFGVPQLRPRFILVALRPQYASRFHWPLPVGEPPTVGASLVDLMGAKGWQGAVRWAQRADRIAPTIVGGSKKHGGPDLGPTRAKRQWATLGVDALGIADEPPALEAPETLSPKLTTRMVARLQGFPDEWLFVGRKTAAYRQIGNAFPPPVARAVGLALCRALSGQMSPLLTAAGGENL